VEAVPDAELVQCIAAGAAAARAAEVELCRRYAPRVRLYGCKHLRDDERARDLVQIVLVGVLEAVRAGRVDDPRHLDRFVLGTCRNSVARMRQQDTRTPLASEEAVAALAVPGVERVELPALYGCVSRLERRAQQVLMLSFFEDQRAEHIASALSLSAGNVRVIRHRALAAIRQCLDGERSEA
jgi:RNA polymerase sigma-70 factor (ECF subfamily)